MQPSFEISVYVFEYDYVGGNDDLGVTNYTYRDKRPTVQTVTTDPGNKNMRYTRNFFESKSYTINLYLAWTKDNRIVFFWNFASDDEMMMKYHWVQAFYQNVCIVLKDINFGQYFVLVYVVFLL